MLHRKQGIVSSGLMTMFWIVYTVLAIPQFRHEIRGYERRPTSTLGTDDLSFEDYQFVSFTVHFGLLVCLAILHLFADQRPSVNRYKNINNDKECPELRSGFVRRMFFIWFEPVMWKSYRTPLVDEDMFDIRPEDMSANMNPRFEKYWQMDVEKKAKQAEAANSKKKSTPKKDEVEDDVNSKRSNVRISKRNPNKIIFNNIFIFRVTSFQ